MSEALAVGRLDVAVADRFGESEELAQLGEHVRRHVSPAGEHWRAGKIAQSHVQSRAMFGDVDGIAVKQRSPPPLDIRSAGEIEQEA